MRTNRSHRPPSWTTAETGSVLDGHHRVASFVPPPKQRAPTPEYSPAEVAVAVEEVIRQVAPELNRVIKYGAPTYQGRGDVITIGVWTNFVAVGFWNGGRLAPDHPLLEGPAKTSRVAKLRRRSEANSGLFRSLIRDAVLLDATHPVHEKHSNRSDDGQPRRTSKRARSSRVVGLASEETGDAPRARRRNDQSLKGISR